MRSYFSGGMLMALACKSKIKILNCSIQYLQCRLLGYLILFATYTFVPQRQFSLKNCFHYKCSFMYLRILTLLIKFHLFVINSSRVVFSIILITNLNFHQKLTIQSTNAIRPVILNNACPSRITAAAGTSISRDFNI